MDSFEETESGVHRVIARPVGHPALVRHLCLWEAPTIAESHRDERVYSYLLSLLHVIRNSASVTCLPIEPITESFVIQRGQEITFSFFWHHIFASVRLEVHTEYITISSILDFSFFPDGDPNWEVKSGERLAHLKSGDASFSRIYEQLLLLLNVRGKRNPKRLSTYLHELIWRSFAEEVTDKNGILAGSSFGKVRGDFRGIITGQPLLKSRDDLERKVKTVDFQKPFTKRRDVRGGLHDYRVPDVEWRSSTIETLLPFVQAHPRLVGYEFTASTLLNGRAIYFSALGSRPSVYETPARKRRLEARDTVWFYIHSSTDDQWDIGRVIDDMTRLGGLRFAAVFQINELRSANSELTPIHLSNQKLLSDIAKLEIQLPVGTDENEIGNFDQEFKQVAVEIVSLRRRREQLDTPFDLGLEYRVRRNRFYIDTFYATLPLVHQGEVEGYLSYEQFILRRLGESFAYIKELDKKLDDLNKVDGELREAYSSLRMVKLTLEIKDVSRTTSILTSEIKEASSKTAALTSAIDHKDKEIESIQDFGEAILLLALFPYYCAHALETLITAPLLPPWDEVVAEICWTAGGVLGFMLYQMRLQKSLAEANEIILESSASAEKIRRMKRWIRLVRIGVVLIVVCGVFESWWLADHPGQKHEAQVHELLCSLRGPMQSLHILQEGIQPLCPGGDYHDSSAPPEKKELQNGSQYNPSGLTWSRINLWPENYEIRK